MSCSQSEMYMCTSKTYHYTVFHPKGIFRLDETDCSGRFLRYVETSLQTFFIFSKTGFHRPAMATNMSQNEHNDEIRCLH